MMQLAFIAATFFYLFPILIGRVILLPWKRNHSFPLSFISYFISGCLSIYLLALTLRYVVLPLLPTISFGSLFENSYFALVFLAIVGNVFSFIKYREKLQFNVFYPFILSFILATIGFTIWTFSSPYPLNWDMFEHQTLVNQVKNGDFSFFPSEISDTFIFDGYSTIFHVLLASAQTVLSPPVLEFWQSITFVHLTITIAASYYFAESVSKNKFIATMSAIFGALVFESVVSYTPFLFIPQTFTAVATILLLSQLLFWKKYGVPPLTHVLFSLFFLILNHYVIGTTGAVLYLFAYLYVRYEPLFKKYLRQFFWVVLGFALLVALPVASQQFNLGTINAGEAEFYTFTLSQKWLFMQTIYGYLLVLFLPLGILASIKNKRYQEMLMVFLLLGILAVVTAEFPYTLKFYTIGRYFVHMFLAIGMWLLLQHIHSNFLRGVALFSLGFLLTIILIVNLSIWKSIMPFKGKYTYLSAGDIKAADFLRQMYGSKNVLLVSEPATQYILEALSGINTQGGAYTHEKTREILDNLQEIATPDAFRDELYKVNDIREQNPDHVLFVLSSRYVLWQKATPFQKRAMTYNIWSPSGLSLSDYRTVQFLLSDTKRFKMVFDNDVMAIFEVF